MSLTISKFVTGPLETNTYVVSLENRPVLVIDPSSNCGKVIAAIKERKATVEAVLLTHGHFDHLLGLSEIKSFAPGAEVWIHQSEKPLLANAEFNGSFLIGEAVTFKGNTRDLEEGAFSVGPYSLEVLFIPGHSPGGVAFVFRDGKETHCISGDSLFPGSIGRYDFPGSDGGLLLKNIKEKLLALPDDTVVYPGHGGRTTIGRERRTNPFLVE
jgi:hydroxyacylglutathione hydrolase